jgi:membrane-bound metal-dependent hydrolase YbcI (DUF457 family)
MYLLCHLAAGLIVGIALFWYFREPVLIVAAAFGGILPDLIDKPLGYIVFRSTIGNGRIYAHTLLFLLLIVFIGVLIWRRYHSLAGIAVALGVLSHQLLDIMWLEPVTWYYPVLGSFPRKEIKDFFLDALIREVTNPSEWLFAAAMIVIAILMLRAGRHPVTGHHPQLFSGLSAMMIATLAGAGVVILSTSGKGIGARLTGLSHPSDILLSGSVMVCIAAIAVACFARERLCTG